MRRKFILTAACAFALAMHAQMPQQDQRLANIDWQEDSTEVTSVADIIKEQQIVTQRSTVGKHYSKVWGYRSFFNISYHKSANITPDETIPTGLDGDMKNVGQMDVEYGGSLQIGRSYRLHKTPIANTAQFNIDIVGFDLNVNYFKARFGSDSIAYVDTKTMKDPKKANEYYYYTPWNMKKIEADYNFTIGPSLTIAPFNYINSRGLNFFKINAYYHIGYQASAIMMIYDKKLVASNTESGSTNVDAKSDNVFEWGHGLVQSFGANLSWRFLGVGFEHRWSTPQYTSVNTSEYGKKWYKFKNTSDRIYLQIRW